MTSNREPLAGPPGRILPLPSPASTLYLLFFLVGAHRCVFLHDRLGWFACYWTFLHVCVKLHVFSCRLLFWVSFRFVAAWCLFV